MFRRCECFDLLTHDVNAAVVGSVELEDHLSHVFGAVDTTGKSKNCRRFSSAGGTVEEEMGEALEISQGEVNGGDVVDQR